MLPTYSLHDKIIQYFFFCLETLKIVVFSNSYCKSSIYLKTKELPNIRLMALSYTLINITLHIQNYWDDSILFQNPKLYVVL